MTSSSLDSDTSVAPFPLLLLEEQPEPLPKWMTYYALASYVWFGIHIIYSWVHLAFVAYIIEEPLLRIQFQPVYDFLAYNSYSILSPMLCTLCILIYHVWNKIKLDDGDFFGLVGVLLLLGLILCYDATGIYHLYSDTSTGLKNKVFDELKENPRESNELSWQYAWSTKPTCARVHSRMNLKKNEEQAKEDQKNEHVLGPKIESSIGRPGEINSWMYEGLSKSDLEKGFLSAILGRAIDPTSNVTGVDEANITSTDTPSNRTSLAAGASSSDPNKDDQTPDERAYENECNKTADSTKPEKPRDWMIKLQLQLECCGPYGREEWEKKVTDLTSCKNFKVGCATKFNEYIVSFLLSTLLIMYIESIFYVITIVFACFHYAAMKYDEGALAKAYSLLNVKDEGFTVIEMNEGNQESRKKRASSILPRGLAPHDPVQDLFFQAHRANQRRLSTVATFSLATTRLRNIGVPLRPNHSAHRRFSHPHANIAHHHSPHATHPTNR